MRFLLETGAFGVVSDLHIAKTKRNLVVRGFERLHPADGFTFTINSAIPLSGGLGSTRWWLRVGRGSSPPAG